MSPLEKTTKKLIEAIEHDPERFREELQADEYLRSRVRKLQNLLTEIKHEDKDLS